MSGKLRDKAIWDIAALALCVGAAAIYLSIYGVGATPDADTYSYRTFAPHRTLGYPAILWTLSYLHLTPILGLLQLTALFAAAWMAWRSVSGVSKFAGLFVLVAVVGNFELVKHCFREMTDALFAAGLLWHVVLMVQLILSGRLSRGAAVGLLISGASVILLRPAGMTIPIATTLALVAYLGFRYAASFAAGILIFAVLVPSSANWLYRGYFATQQFGGVLMLTPAVVSVVSLDEETLSEQERALRRALAPAAQLVDSAGWPYDRAFAAESVATYILHKAYPEIGSVVGDPHAAKRLSEGRERNLAERGILYAPIDFLKSYSATLLSLMGLPGFVSETSRSDLLARLAPLATESPEFGEFVYGSLTGLRSIHPSILTVVRTLGVLVFGLAGASAIVIVIMAFRRLAGRPIESELTAIDRSPVPFLGLVLISYLLLTALVTAIPRFVLVIHPVIVLFLVFVAIAVVDKIDGRTRLRGSAPSAQDLPRHV